MSRKCMYMNRLSLLFQLTGGFFCLYTYCEMRLWYCLYIKSCERLHSISVCLFVFHHVLARFRSLPLIPFCIYLRVFPMKSVPELSATWLLVLVLDLSSATNAVPWGSWQSSGRETWCLSFLPSFLPAECQTPLTLFVICVIDQKADSQSPSVQTLSVFFLYWSAFAVISLASIHRFMWKTVNSKCVLLVQGGNKLHTEGWWGTGKGCRDQLCLRDFTGWLPKGNSSSLPWLLWSTCVIKIYKGGMHSEW